MNRQNNDTEMDTSNYGGRQNIRLHRLWHRVQSQKTKSGDQLENLGHGDIITHIHINGIQVCLCKK